MKKISDRQQEEHIAPQYGFRKLRPTKIPKYAWAALVLSFAMAILLFVLYAISWKGARNNSKTLLIYSDGSNIPAVSLRNDLASAGFGLEIIEPDYHSAETGYVYGLPKDYAEKDVVVCAIGKDAFKVMNDLLKTRSDNILGYVLVDPEYPGNASLEGYTNDYPGVPCAIFGFDTKAETSGELNGAQMIFEKISGVDTLYGHPTTRGKIFPSKVYVSPNQMRYLSLSSSKFGVNVLLPSASFRGELSQYLGTTFGRGYSLARVKYWTIALVLAEFVAVAALAFFLFMVPVTVPDKGSRELKGRDSLGAIIFLGVSAWIALTGAVMTFIPYTKNWAKYIALYAPIGIIALMAFAQIKLLASKKVKYARKDNGPTLFLVSILIGLLELMIIIASVLDLTNIERTLKTKADPVAALLVFVIMSLSAVALIYADKKSRFSGQGPTAYFGSPVYFAEVLIPSATLMTLGLIQGNTDLVKASFSGILIGVIPFLCVTPIKRISDFYEITGLIFGIVAALIVLVAGLPVSNKLF